MQKYTVIIERNVLQRAMVDVQASCAEAAKRIALAEPQDKTWYTVTPQVVGRVKKCAREGEW